jgi:Protein of unknown function (DUF3489)
MSIKLTDAQLLMLSAAAQRKDRILAMPPNLKGAAAHKVAAKLIAAGLVKEIKVKKGAPTWRRDEETQQSIALKLTTAGLKASAIAKSEVAKTAAETQTPHHDADALRKTPLAPAASPDASAAASNWAEASDRTDAVIPTTVAEAPARRIAPTIESCSESASIPREGTKIANVLELLQRDEGATLDEVIAATGWLPHTSRAALTGLRKRGYGIERRAREEGGRAYAIAAARQMGS